MTRRKVIKEEVLHATSDIKKLKYRIATSLAMLGGTSYIYSEIIKEMAHTQDYGELRAMLAVVLYLAGNLATYAVSDLCTLRIIRKNMDTLNPNVITLIKKIPTTDTDIKSKTRSI